MGELVGEFGTGATSGVDTTGSQATPSTALETSSMISGGPGRAVHHRTPSDDTPTHHHHHHRLSADGDQNNHVVLSNLDQQSVENMIDDIDMPMSSASVSSHLVVSPGASVSGSAASLAANPPSEIAGDDDDEVCVDGEENVDGSPAPISVVVASGSTTDNENTPGSQVVDSGVEGIRQELKATGPPPEEIINRQLRPGMGQRTTPQSPLQSPRHSESPIPGRMAAVNNAETTIDEFDFDKHDDPMTPRSCLSDIRDLPGDGDSEVHMTVSPIHPRGTHPYINVKDRLMPPLIPGRGNGASEDGQHLLREQEFRESSSSPNRDQPAAAFPASSAAVAAAKSPPKEQPPTSTLTDRNTYISGLGIGLSVGLVFGFVFGYSFQNKTTK